MGMRVSRADLQRIKAERRGHQPQPASASPKPDGAARPPQSPHDRVTFQKMGARPQDIHALAARLEAYADGAMKDATEAVRALVERCDAFEKDFADAQARITRLEGGVATAGGRVRDLEEAQPALVMPPPDPIQTAQAFEQVVEAVAAEGSTTTEVKYPPAPPSIFDEPDPPQSSGKE